MDMESVKLYRRLVLGVPIMPRNPPPEAAAGARPPPPPALGRGSGLDSSRSAPSPMVFATRRFALISSGPRPELRDRTGSPEDGLGSSRQIGRASWRERV